MKEVTIGWAYSANGHGTGTVLEEEDRRVEWGREERIILKRIRYTQVNILNRQAPWRLHAALFWRGTSA
jgi:hypothetical protein